MKRIKLILGVLVIAAALMGAGYAAWVDETTVAGTVETGTMDVNIQWADLHTPPYVEGNIDYDENNINVSISNLYPTKYKATGEGAGDTYARLHFQVKNEGTVPVMLDRVELVKGGDDILWDWLRTRVHVIAGIPSPGKGTSIQQTNNLQGSPNALEGDLKDLDTILMAPPRNPNYEVLNGYVLQPGYAIRFGGTDEDSNSIRIFLDKDAPNDTQDKEVNFTLKFYWKQFNM